MKLVVLGSHGMVGSMIVSLARSRPERDAVALTRERFGVDDGFHAPAWPLAPAGRGRLRGNGMERSGPDEQAALQECGSWLQGVRREFDPGRQVERKDNQLALAQCLREQGLEVADPDFSAGPGPGKGGLFGQSGLDRNDPDVRSALEFCRDEVGFRRGLGVGGSGRRGGGQ